MEWIAILQNQIASWPRFDCDVELDFARRT